MVTGQYQKQISALPTLNSYRYENILKMYQTDKGNQYYYNLLQSIFLPDNLDKRALTNMVIRANQPWTTVSFNAYGTIELWWLILLTNKIYNPFETPKPNTVIKIIRPEYIPDILKEISARLQ